ncbi:hypothetical protein D3C87_1643150 [compost metagenome]
MGRPGAGQRTAEAGLSAAARPDYSDGLAGKQADGDILDKHFSIARCRDGKACHRKRPAWHGQSHFCGFRPDPVESVLQTSSGLASRDEVAPLSGRHFDRGKRLGGQNGCSDDRAGRGELVDDQERTERQHA